MCARVEEGVQEHIAGNGWVQVQRAGSVVILLACDLVKRWVRRLKHTDAGSLELSWDELELVEMSAH